ncbi:sacsin N-terminal ATP-binding-like domain-containing protein [Micromonospora sp. L32]|uniref:sacsin N-terminal ATP-binding-like domain-containing protein n=1 Tax=Micromonospora sp. L32 TaxID=3452214 RepID=UPI003F8B0EC6
MREEFRGRIVAEADGVAALYRFGKEVDQPATREQKEFIEGIVATDYDGRTVVELLQNGHDAHPADRNDGQLEFLLHEDEGPWGVLYVANGGSPLRHENFTAMCRVAMSSKRPDEGIGNKGVGFKSVLQLADSPEIYSAAEVGTGSFDGYCFRFATPADFDDLAARVAPDEPGLADELRENVASLKVPVPLGTCPDVVAGFAVKGFATVIRLVLRSSEARDQARRQLAELTSSEVPFHLFLERVARIVVSRVEADQKIRRTVCERRSAGVTARDDLALEEIVLQSKQRFLVLRQPVPEAMVKDAIVRSRNDGRVSAGWDRWEGDAQIRVALPLDTSLAQGRLYTFLPMSETAPAPMAGFVNAPFFARLDRRSLDPEIPLNDLLLDQVANLCARATKLAVDGELGIGAELIVDMVAWRKPFLSRLVNAFQALGHRIADIPFVPALGDRCPRTAISRGKLWEATATAFTPAAAAAAGVDHLIDPDLTPQRRYRIKQLAADLGIGLTPRDDEIAAWAEAYADALARGPFDPGTWADFYEDLAAVMANGALLAGKRILVDDRGSVLPASAGKDGGPTVFLAPQGGDDVRTSSLRPPRAVAQRIAFVHPDITWRPADPPRKRQPARQWLTQHGLVQEYHTDAVLNLVGAAMRGADPADEPLLRSCLRFAFTIWRSTARDVAADVVARAGLLVPTVGWRPATEALFGTSWPGPRRDLDNLLVRLLGRASSLAPFDALAERLVPEPQAMMEDLDDADALRVFLEHAGVQHGLPITWLPSSSFRMTGSRVGAPATAPDFPVDVSKDHQKTWRAVAAQWPRQPPARPTATYEPTRPVAVLAGQLAYSQLDPTARGMYAELVLHGLDQWPDTALEFQYGRPSDVRRVAWPTFIAAFLATTAWLPQTTPGRRSEVSFMSPSRAWWLEAAETPDYLRAQPPALRSLATTKVLDRLKKIGVRFWDHPMTAAERLVELTDIVGSHRLAGRAQSGLAVRKAYELAWRDLANTGAAVPSQEPLQVVAARAGRLTVVSTTEEAETVYVPAATGAGQELLLRQAPVLMLAIRNQGLAEHVLHLLIAAGARCLRSTADAKVDMSIDGLPAAMAPSVPLLATVGPWLTTVVLAVMEFRSRTVADITSAQLKAAAQRLDAATITFAGRVSTSVDLHEIDDPRTARSFLLEEDGRLRVVVAGGHHQPVLSMLQTASHGLAQLVRMPNEADNLRLAFIDLQQCCGDTDQPTPADIASALGVANEDIATLMAAHAGKHLDVSQLVAVLACVDIDVAEELQDARPQFDTEDALIDWLGPRLSAQTVTNGALLDLANRGDLLEAVRVLGTDLATANRGLRALARPPLHNVDGHLRQFTAFLQQNRRALQDRVRDAFLPDYRAGQSLDAYLRLRQMPNLEPSEEWLDEYWNLPVQIITDRVEAWFQQNVPHVDHHSGLASVDETRDANRRTLSRILKNAVPLVEAWLYRNAAGEGFRPTEPATVAELMMQAGLLDFERLTAPVVTSWLHANHQWPTGMPLTTNRAELGLTDQDIAEARQRIDQDKDQQRRKPTFVLLDGRTYSAETDLVKLADAVRGSITPELLAMPAEPRALGEFHSAHAGGGRAGGARGWTAGIQSDPEALKTIGLAGEVVAGEWLRHQFGIPPEDSWMSGYRNLLLGDGKGDDSLGYDFRIMTRERIRLFEVKATVNDHPEFTLGETEVCRAQNLGPDEEYLILFIVNVLESARRRIILLPNPLAPGGLRRYRVAGRSIRLQFDPHTG